MRFHTLVTAAALLAACGAHESKPLNRWTDDRLWPVLEAQERRDAGTLCGLLNNEAAAVREAAALAFASAQDSASILCLIRALNDSVSTVRSTAAYALGIIADSTTIGIIAETAMIERDAEVQHALLRASFIAMQRNGMLHDANALLYYLDREIGHERARAADALRRMPDSAVYNAAEEIHERMGAMETDARQFLILAMRKMGDRAVRSSLGRIAIENPRTNERVSALRAYGALYTDSSSMDVLLGNTLCAAEGHAALAALASMPALPAKRLGWEAQQQGDTLLRIGLLSLVLKHGNESEADSARLALLAIGAASLNPYHRAAAIVARTNAPVDRDIDACMELMRSDAHPAERQAAFHGAVTNARAIMMRSRYASREAQYAGLRQVIEGALSTGDPGLICVAAELLVEEDAETVALLLSPAAEQEAVGALHTLRDLEAKLLMAQAAAKRDGRSSPAHRAPPFNHPINHERLLGLKQGQQYRIATSKGDIIIATDVDECPGSSLAFDSLVTAGYYDGKAFHRMVPGFVIQGGCPRGDGYGGMPWTLRTEISRSPFTAGAVGLASAGRDTESCQFFITQAAAPHLDGRYTRFGEVTAGMDVVWQVGVGDRIIRVTRED